MATADQVSPWKPGEAFAGMSTVTVDIDGTDVVVKIDPYYGPQPTKVGGTPPGPNDCYQLPMNADENAPSGVHKKWSEFTSTEQKMAVYQVARMNMLRQEHGEAVLQQLAFEAQLKEVAANATVSAG
mmetsp:Transcript_33409/g.59199  ORF Transcript_33409/g.59199 Transcript_33409/m.59199 type:complete len:127 (-) Transcript_33409:39-419(-)